METKGMDIRKVEIKILTAGAYAAIDAMDFEGFSSRDVLLPGAMSAQDGLVQRAQELEKEIRRRQRTAQVYLAAARFLQEKKSKPAPKGASDGMGATYDRLTRNIHEELLSAVSGDTKTLFAEAWKLLSLGQRIALLEKTPSAVSLVEELKEGISLMEKALRAKGYEFKEGENGFFWESAAYQSTYYPSHWDAVQDAISFFGEADEVVPE